MKTYRSAEPFVRWGTSVALAAAVTLAASSAMARNDWNDYHWEFPWGETQLTINFNNCQDGNLLYYDINHHFYYPNDDWHAVINDPDGDIIIADGSCEANTSTPGNPIAEFSSQSIVYDSTATNPPDEGTVNAFNGDFGGTGWVGVAIIELEQSSGDNHIVYGETHLNDYYPKYYSVYNDALVMRKIQCQEGLHVLGLDHVKRDNSCMYSSSAFIGSTYTPSNHDGDMVNKITHGHGGSEPPPPEDDSGGPCAKNPNHWKCQAAGRILRGKATWVESYGSQQEMFDAADAVVRARVLNGSSFDRLVGPPGRGLPVSQAVLLVETSFKGNAKGAIRIEQTRGLGLEIEDDPGYINDDEYLLFLRRIGANTFRVVNPSGRIPQ